MPNRDAPQLQSNKAISGQEPMLGTRATAPRTLMRRMTGSMQAGLNIVNGLVAGTFGGDSNPQRIIRNLSQSLQHDDRPAVRHTAAHALGRIGGRAAARALTQTVLDDDDLDLRIVAAQSLGQTRHPFAIHPLLLLLDQDEPARLQAAACRALGQLGSRHAEAVPQIITALLKHLQTGPDGLRVAAFDALTRIRDTASTDNLLSALTATNSVTRQAAASMLGWQRRREAIPELLLALRDDDSDVRKAAGDALIVIGDSSAIPGLLDACRDPDQHVRAAAAYTLERIGSF